MRLRNHTFLRLHCRYFSASLLTELSIDLIKRHLVIGETIPVVQRNYPSRTANHDNNNDKRRYLPCEVGVPLSDLGRSVMPPRNGGLLLYSHHRYIKRTLLAQGRPNSDGQTVVLR